ncbi:MAG: hypothetical protein ACI4V1_09255, partial [Eubacteriales bacterium]
FSLRTPARMRVFQSASCFFIKANFVVKKDSSNLPRLRFKTQFSLFPLNNIAQIPPSCKRILQTVTEFLHDLANMQKQ